MIDFKRAPSVGVEDLVLLPKLSDKDIAENLKQRYAKDLIYTSIGNVLISVNPFKRLPIYTEEQIRYYRGGHGNVPHIYQLAEDTYRTMILEEENQCVIISGESGAGKTEASKQIMQYVAAVSGNSKEMQRVKEIMLESNPLLEAFGNAKTVRNDNSSRFGKFFEIYFDRVGGPVGGKMSNFLLEKSRVVAQQRGERNFHIFYQICRGADEGLRARLRLKQPGDFFYLNQGATLDRAGVDDAKEFRETVDAMKAIGISETNKNAIFDMVAAILHLGELKFQQKPGEESFYVTDKDALAFVAGLLAVDADQLERGLTWKRLEMGSEIVNVPLDIQQCNNSRDAVAKMIYDKLFNFVVESVNEAFGKQTYALMLGVLDIYGFEIFDKNGFEQFCINYVNEKLQQIFIELTLKAEQEEYVREKIQWEEIKFFNNKIVCELIEGKQPPGIFAVIDDVCAAMAKEKESVADIKMLDKLDGAHMGHAHFKRTDRGFMIKHFAGDVHYDAAGFTNRNKDLLSPDIVLVLSTTSSPFLSMLLAEVFDTIDTGSPKSGGAKKRSMTAGSRIRSQAADLVKTLMSCQPHYVRTIKPNDEKRADFFDDPRVTHQVKYLGLLENIKVRRAGFSYRQYFDKFMKRFKYCSPATFPRPFRGSDKDACAAVLSHCGGAVPQGTWQLGQTKVFIRQPQHLFALEDIREKCFDNLAAKIQKAWGRFRNDKEYIVLKANLDKIYRKARKERRADSVFRPFQGEYINYRKDMEPLHPFVSHDPVALAWQEFYADGSKRYYYNIATGVATWDRPVEMDKQKIIFTDKVQRVVDHAKGTLGTEFMVITDRNVFLMAEEYQTIVTPPTKPTRANPKPPPPPAPYTILTYALKKRLDMRVLAGVSVSQLADTAVVLHFYRADPVPTLPLAPVAAPEPEPEPEKPGKKGAAKKPAPKKKGAAAAAAPEPKKPAAPERHPLDPVEPTEDVVILTPLKSEVVAMIRKVYKRTMGSKIPIQIANAIPYQLHADKSVVRQVTFVPATAAGGDTTVTAQPNQLIIAAPPGISQTQIETIEKSREQRRLQAMERHKAELEAEREKEAQKEKEREEARKRQVEERKRQKKEADEKEERERVEREQAMRDRQARAQRLVAERSSK